VRSSIFHHTTILPHILFSNASPPALWGAATASTRPDFSIFPRPSPRAQAYAMIVYPPSQRHMPSQPSKTSPQPGRPAASRAPSFPQHSPGAVADRDSLKPPKRAHTFHNGAPAGPSDGPDAFETSETDPEDNVEVTRASVELDDLPIELITLTDRWVLSTYTFIESWPHVASNIASHPAASSSLSAPRCIQRLQTSTSCHSSSKTSTRRHPRTLPPMLVPWLTVKAARLLPLHRPTPCPRPPVVCDQRLRPSARKISPRLRQSSK